jgi:hypothetical protein
MTTDRPEQERECPCPDCDTRPPRLWTEEELGPQLAEGETFDVGRWAR